MGWVGPKKPGPFRLWEPRLSFVFVPTVARARPPTRRPTPSTFDPSLSFKKSTTGSLCSVCVCVCLSAVLLPPSSGIRSFFLRKAFFLVGGRKPVTRFSFSPHPQPRTQEEDHGGRDWICFPKGPRNVSSRTFPPQFRKTSLLIISTHHPAWRDDDEVVVVKPAASCCTIPNTQLSCRTQNQDLGLIQKLGMAATHRHTPLFF